MLVHRILATLLVLAAADLGHAAKGQKRPSGPAPMAAVAAEPASAPSTLDAAPASEDGAPVDEAARQPLAADAAAVQAADDESIYVVQRRAYSKSGRFEVTPMFFTSLNNKFVGYVGPALSAAYHVRENFAVEVMSSVPYAYYSFYSALVFEVRDSRLNLEPEPVDMKQMKYFGAASAQYSALYGKLDFNDHHIDYDFYVQAGAGLSSTAEICHPPRPDGTGGDPACGQTIEGIGYGQKAPVSGSDRFKLAGNLGGGMRVFFAENMGLRLEVRDIVYADRATLDGVVTTDIRNNVIFFAGLSLLF